MDNSKLTKPFYIQCVNRQDLIQAGYEKEQVMRLTDKQMETLAYNMADFFSDEVFADALEECCQQIFKMKLKY